MTPEYKAPISAPSPKKSKAPLIVGGCAGLLFVVIVLGVGGYAFYHWRSTSTTNSNTSGGTKATQPRAGASPRDSNTNANQSAPTTPGAESSWTTNASTATEETKTLTQICSAGGTPHSVWGSDVYTVDSSICTAAVHAGLITFERGGTVTIEFRAGRSIYGSTEKNGVTTSVFGPYRRSFIFSGTARTEAEDSTPIRWDTPAAVLADEPGKTYRFNCPADGKANAIWGTDVYTADSSICNAAVHVGRITLTSGGLVTIELRAGQTSYQGTLRNEVKSNDYGAYSRSFAVK